MARFDTYYVKIAEAVAFSIRALEASADSLGESTDYDTSSAAADEGVLKVIVDVQVDDFDEEISEVAFEVATLAPANNTFGAITVMATSTTPYAPICKALNDFVIRTVLAATSQADLATFIDEAVWTYASAPAEWLTLCESFGYTVV